MTQYQPGPYAPMPPQPPRRSTGAKIAIGFGVAFAVLMVLGIFGAVFGEDPAAKKDEPKAAAPKAEPEPEDTETEKSPDEVLEETIEENEKNRKELDDQVKEEGAKDGQFYDGDWVVGEDMKPGTYESAGAKKGLFELCSISTEPTDASTFPQWKTANADERIIITLSEADGVVSISGCEPLKLRK